MIKETFPAIGVIAPTPDDFESWLGDRHKWLQTAAHKLVESRALPTDAEIAELSRLCLAEASGVGVHPFASVVPGSIGQAAKRPRLQLTGLSNVRGVNKIKSDASINFGSGNLAVVYGANGSGKTGFARVIKQACGSRTREDIHSNVFSKNNPEGQRLSSEQRAQAQAVADRLGTSAVGIFDRAAMHVPVEIAKEAIELAKRLHADCAIAIGGGSTIGLGKAIALEAPPDLPMPILAIPTTYAGSEVTPIFGVTEGGSKRTGTDLRVLPRNGDL